MSEYKPKFQTLTEIYERSMRAFPNQPLFGTKKHGRWEWMTYREFGQQVDAMRGALAERGISKGDRVAIIADNRSEWAVAAYATYGLGGAFVPMYESQLPKEWDYILRDCGAKMLFVANERIRDEIANLQIAELTTVVVMDGSANRSTEVTFAELIKHEPAPMVSLNPEDIAGYIYTSGTTGNPKGVLLSHKNLANNVSAIHEIFPISTEDRSLSFLPWAHSFGQTVELHGLFSMGASMGIAEAVDKIVSNLAEVQPTLLFSVPRIFNRIYDGVHKKMAEAGGLKKSMFDAAIKNANLRRKLEGERKRSGFADFKQTVFDKLVFSKVRDRFGGKLKYAFSGGAALSKEVAEFVDNLGILVYEGYGLTETSPIATANSPSGRKLGSVGRPIPGVRVEIDTTATDDPKQGELVIYGHNVMLGYHGLPEEDEKVMILGGAERGFRTGDMGFVDDDGFVFITGRIKEQYKLLNGKYVVPTPLEEQVKLSPYISNVMVHGANQNHNAAIVVPAWDMVDLFAKEHHLSSNHAKLCTDPKIRDLIEKEITEWSASFKSYESIKKFAIVEEDFTIANGMLTPSLKLKRRAVLETYDKVWKSLFA